MKSAERKKRKSKHDEPMRIKTTPEKLAASLFNGPPKSVDQWKYLKSKKDK